MKEKKDVMSVKDVSEYYGVSQSAIYRLRDENSRLEAENENLKKKIKKITSELLVISGEI